jgi:hypothetical protein
MCPELVTNECPEMGKMLLSNQIPANHLRATIRLTSCTHGCPTCLSSNLWSHFRWVVYLPIFTRKEILWTFILTFYIHLSSLHGSWSTTYTNSTAEKRCHALGTSRNLKYAGFKHRVRRRYECPEMTPSLPVPDANAFEGYREQLAISHTWYI